MYHDILKTLCVVALVVFLGVCAMLWKHPITTDIEPAAGPLQTSINVRAQFQQASLTAQYDDATSSDRKTIAFHIPTGITPPSITTCRGSHVHNRRCVTYRAMGNTPLSVVFPPSPVGTPAALERTWTDILYF